MDLHSKHVWRTPPATASFTHAKPVLASGPFAPLSPGKFVLVQETCYRKNRNFEPCLSFQMTMNILTVAPAAAVLTITASRLEDIKKKNPEATHTWYLCGGRRKELTILSRHPSICFKLNILSLAKLFIYN